MCHLVKSLAEMEVKVGMRDEFLGHVEYCLSVNEEEYYKEQRYHLYQFTMSRHACFARSDHYYRVMAGFKSYLHVAVLILLIVSFFISSER